MTSEVQNPNWVISQVQEMQNIVRHGNRRRLKNEFAEFKQQCPAIYEKASKPMDATEMEMLLSMLRHLQNIRENKVSQHESSVQVGQMLVDRYIAPVVGQSETT